MKTSMRKRLKLMIVACCLISFAFAQQNNTAVKKRLQDDNSAFTFTETQLNENDDAVQGMAANVSSNNDVYLSNVGYLFSPVRFRVRGYDSQYNDMYINGVKFNDAETGRFSYGLIGGLNDATRNSEGAAAFESNLFGFSPIGGATNINVRASQYAAGNQVRISGGNRNYLLRGMYTFSTGLMSNGWAFTGSASYRWANEGVIEGTFYNSLAYFLAAEKVFNDKHSISFATWGNPTERGQQQASTEEAYWLANDHYYNPNWGYQNGEKRNARVVNSYEPSAVFTWDFKINQDMKLTTSLGGKYSMYGTTALGWNGNAADPRPDYYKKLPSSIFNVYTTTDPTAEQMAQFNEVRDYWTSSKAHRQIDWDGLYFANAQAAAVGGEALYYQEERHNDQLAINLNSSFNHILNPNENYTVGLHLSTTKGMHYKTMKDLLGATSYIDIDKFAVRDHGYGSDMIQNDLNNPNRQISKGDKFGYNYDIYVNKANAWIQYVFKDDKISGNFSAKVGGVEMWRDGKMRNGRAANKSYGESGKSKFLEGGGKFNLAYKINGNHSIILGAGFEERAPLAYNSFLAPRIKNDYVANLKTEGILNSELSYLFNSSFINGRLSGYYTRFFNGVEMDAFYNDNESRFTYLAMNGVQKEHYGVEAAFELKITSNLSATAIATWSDAQYKNNPTATVSYENESETRPDFVYAKGMRVGGTPLSAYSLGLNYNIGGWFLGLNGNYYDRTYIDFSTYTRLGSVVKTETGVDGNGNTITTTNIPSQEKFKGGFMLDASIGKFLRFRNGHSLSINLTVNNILNNTKLRTGGYEQNRDDRYEDGDLRTYVFSKNSKYFYALGFNAFLNLGYRF